MIRTAGKRTVLFVLVPADEKLGVMTLSIRQSANKVAAIFG